MWVSPLTFLRSSSPGSSGWIDTPNQRLSIQHILPISNASELAQIPVAGHPDLVLGDVADIVEDHQQLIGDALVGDGDGLMLVIEKFPDVSTLEVTNGVEEALEAMAPGLSGITVDSTVFRSANSIEQMSTNISGMLMLSAALIALILIAFYFGWRSVLINLLTIALSLILAVFVLHLRGATFNVMVLAGLAMALFVIIDDSIVDVENIVRRLKQGREDGSELSTMEAIVTASLETRGPLWFAFLVSALLILPLFFLDGLTGAFLQPFVLSYILAIVSSLIVAVTLTPALSVIILTNVAPKSAEPVLMQSIRSSYKGILAGLLKAPAVMVIGLTAVIIAIGVALLLPLHVALLPEFKSTELRIRVSVILVRMSDEPLQAIKSLVSIMPKFGSALTQARIMMQQSPRLKKSLKAIQACSKRLKAIDQNS
jgi:Cu/Ag efflux pump CusA